MDENTVNGICEKNIQIPGQDLNDNKNSNKSLDYIIGTKKHYFVQINK